MIPEHENNIFCSKYVNIVLTFIHGISCDCEANIIYQS